MEEHCNNYYAVIGWMLSVINHIRENVFKNTKTKHHIQFNTVIKSLFTVSTEKESHETLDTFWSEYKRSIIIMILLTVIDLSGTVNIFVM